MESKASTPDLDELVKEVINKKPNITKKFVFIAIAIGILIPFVPYILSMNNVTISTTSGSPSTTVTHEVNYKPVTSSTNPIQQLKQTTKAIEPPSNQYSKKYKVSVKDFVKNNSVNTENTILNSNTPVTYCLNGMTLAFVPKEFNAGFGSKLMAIYDTNGGVKACSGNDYSKIKKHKIYAIHKVCYANTTYLISQTDRNSNLSFLHHGCEVS